MSSPFSNPFATNPLLSTAIYGAAVPDEDEFDSRAGRPLKQYLTPEREETLMGQLARQTGGSIEFLGKALDTTGAIARGVLAEDPGSGFSWDSDRRVTGEELLEKYGIIDDSVDPWVRSAAGFAAEIATDPLTWLTGPMASLSKAGKAAKAANVLDLAPIAAQRRMGVTAASKTMAGRFTDDALRNLDKRGLTRTAGDYAVRPLVGPRLARSTTTLDEVIKASNDPTKALDDVLKYLQTTGDKYDDIKDMKLGGALGLGFFTPSATFTPAGSEKVLDAMDWAGQRLGWSAAGRHLGAWFDQRLAGRTGEADQIAALRRDALLQGAKEEGRKKAVQHVMTVSEIPLSQSAKAMLGADSLFSREGNEFLLRLFENKPTARDLTLKAEMPGIEKAVESWDQLRKAHIEQARELGMRVNKYGDEYGVLYSPRSASELDFEDYGTGIGRSLFNTATTEGFSRQKYLITPGGTDDLRQISLLPEVREHAMRGADSPKTDGEIAGVIQKWFDNKYGPGVVPPVQSIGITKVMSRLNKDLPSDYPLFAQHPVTAQARSIVNQESAAANARFLYDSLAESAINARNTDIAGGQFKKLDTALNDIAQRTNLRLDGLEAAPSVRRNLLKRISQRTGIPVNQIDLSRMAIPEQVYNRLTAMHDFYQSPRAQEEVANMFNKFTTAMKSFLLAWPSRHVRDMYSNAFSVWAETGSATDTLMGFKAAKAILAGNFDEAAPLLKMLPQYAKLPDTDSIKNQFMQDAGSTGVLSTLATSDLLSSNISGDIAQLVPGSTPITRWDAIKELIPDGSRNPLQMIQDFGAIRNVSNKYETRNPLLNASNKLSDVNDSIARLGGFIALLRQGNNPQQAAQRMSAALVDYSSLTPIERNVFRNIFPWWAYNSRIGKYVVEQLMQKPGGIYGQTIRGMTTLQAANEDTYVPTSLRQQVAVRVPDWLYPFAGKSDTTTYLTDFDLPVSVLENFVPGDLQGTFGQFMNQSHPLLRTVAELGTNTDFFSKRPLDEATTRLDRIWQQLSGRPTGLPAVAKAAIYNIPGLQRPINFFGGLADQRIPIEQRWWREGFNAISGVKERVVDPNWVFEDAQRKLKEDLKGWTRSGGYMYVPEERIPFMPAEDYEKYMLSKELARKAKMRKKAEKRGGETK